MIMIKLRKKTDTGIHDPAQGAPPKSLRLMSVGGAAKYAGVSATTIRRWVSNGELGMYRAGRQIRIDEADLIEFMKVS